MMGGGPRLGWEFPSPEKVEEAESGLGEAALVVAGRDPREVVPGVKSNSGARRGATPYWVAISRPRSRGILATRRMSARKVQGGDAYQVPWYLP